MKQIFVRGGSVIVEDVPAPAAAPKSVLVRVGYSCVSPGTEVATVRHSGQSLAMRALKQPENVKKFIGYAKEYGLKRAVDKASGRLAAGMPVGYSAAGQVVDIGAEVAGFAPGDLVACAGAGIANHAEMISVPVNLVTPIPSGVSIADASTVALGAIAMQGVRRAGASLGETVAVIGLGFIGQLTVAMLKSSGCYVIGSDPDSRRREFALNKGMDAAFDPVSDDFAAECRMRTSGIGVDAVIVTAASASDEIVRTAMQSCRKKGKVVIVGDVGLGLRREDMYAKELDFLISTSYGPGRYDHAYEQDGVDYPLAYVRWTENRNMDAYLRMIGDGKISLEGMTQAYSVDNASKAYEALKGADEEKPLVALIGYEPAGPIPSRTVMMNAPKAPAGVIRVGVAGAGGFALGVHLPNLAKLGKRYAISGIMSRNGAAASSVAKNFGAGYATTDYGRLIADPDIDLIMITTRHDSHGAMTLEALKAGKNVFVEKPLAVTREELGAIEKLVTQAKSGPMLTVGYNRRFSPAIVKLRNLIKESATPFMAVYKMNAGYLPPEHWTHGPQGGGRNIGEACHIYDLFTYLAGGVAVESVSASSIKPRQANWGRFDNFSATVKFADGSVCTLVYTALGTSQYPKERMELFTGGGVYALDDYKSLVSHVANGAETIWKGTQDKGHMAELEAIAAAMENGGAWPIGPDELIQASSIAFDVQEAIARPEFSAGPSA